MVLRVYVKDITYTFDKHYVYLICVHFKDILWFFFARCFMRILSTFYVLRVFFLHFFTEILSKPPHVHALGSDSLYYKHKRVNLVHLLKNTYSDL